MFTPLLAYNAMLNTLFTHNREVGSATYRVRGRAELAGHPPVTFEETFSGDAATVMAALYLGGPVTALLNNGFEPVTVDGIDVSITAYDDVRTAELERVWLDDPRPRPGHTVPLRIAVRTHRGDEITRTIMVDLPATARGRLQLLVADGTTLAQQEREQSGQRLQATDLNQLIDALNKTRRNNRLYVQLLRPDAGAVVNGRRLASLPPSVLSVLGADPSSGSFTPLRKRDRAGVEHPAGPCRDRVDRPDHRSGQRALRTLMEISVPRLGVEAPVPPGARSADTGRM